VATLVVSQLLELCFVVRDAWILNGFLWENFKNKQFTRKSI